MVISVLATALSFPAPAAQAASLEICGATNAWADENAPFPKGLHLQPDVIQHVRGIAISQGRAVLAVYGCELTFNMTMDYFAASPPGTATVFVSNPRSGGIWIVTHLKGRGENGSSWVRPFARDQRTFIIRSPEVTATGRAPADSLGFVRQGFLGIATPDSSFTWQTFWPLVSQMRVTFTAIP